LDASTKAFNLKKIDLTKSIAALTNLMAANTRFTICSAKAGIAKTGNDKILMTDPIIANALFHVAVSHA